MQSTAYEWRKINLQAVDQYMQSVHVLKDVAANTK